MAIRLNGSTSGYIEIDAPAVAGTTAITLPATSGGNFVVTDSAGDLNIDSGTFFVDASTNRVGVGTTSPASILHLSGSSDQIYTLQTTTSGADNRINFRNSGGTDAGGIWYKHNGNHLAFNTGGSNSESARIDGSGRLLVGTTSSSEITTAVFQGNSSSATGAASIYLQRGAEPTGTQDFGSINFADNDGDTGAWILGERDGGTWTAGSSHPGALSFGTTANGSASPTQRMRITSAGNVGIGTGSPSNLLDIQGNTPRLEITDTAGTGNAARPGVIMRDSGATNLFFIGNGATANSDLTIRNYTSAGATSLWTNNTERMRVDSAGRLLVGTSSNIFSQKFQVATTDGQAAEFSRFNTNGGGPELNFISSRNATIGSHTIKQSGDALGRIYFRGSDGSNYRAAAGIGADVDGTPGTNDMPGRLEFYTTADGASSPTERMRITSSGKLLLGDTVSSQGDFVLVVRGSNDVLYVDCERNDTGGTAAIFKRTANNGDFIRWQRGSSTIGNIYANASSVSYNTTSDYRLKENVVDLDGAITRVKQLAPKRFNFIADADTTVDGFLAHEAQAVVPEAVTGTHNEVDDDGNAVMQGIDQSKLVPLLTAALQEAIAKIETLEAKVAALEAN